MSYNPINWQNDKIGGTKVNATNLNIMDKGIADAHDMLADHDKKINDFANEQIPEEYVKESVDNYIAENQAGLASKEEVSAVAENVNRLSSEIDNVNEDFTILENHLKSEWIEMYSKDTLLYGRYYNENGEIAESEAWKITPDIELNGVKFRYSCTRADVYAVFKDENKNVIEVFKNIVGTNIEKRYPLNAKYVSMSVYWQDVENFSIQLLISKVATDGIELRKGLDNFISAYEWEYGAFATATGAEVSDTVSIRTKNYIRFDSDFVVNVGEFTPGSGYRVKFISYDSGFNFVASGAFITEDAVFTPDSTKLYRIQISLVDTRYNIELNHAIANNGLIRTFKGENFYGNLNEIYKGIVEHNLDEITENVIAFENPTENGMTAVHVNDYFPFRTDRLIISDIRGNAMIGLCYGDDTMSNGYRILVGKDNSSSSGYSVTFTLISNGKIINTQKKTLPVNPIGNYLQIQNTGRAAIVSVFDKDLKWFSMTGGLDAPRFDWGTMSWGASMDARKEVYTSTWKTYVCAMTNNKTAEDYASFSHYDTAMRSGENASSIRFLTYEDGSFIQKGDWLYYLVEGTAQTIQDLFTAIFKINLKTNEVQMVGSLFVVRDDGVDDGLILGDTSAKILYDRNDKKWKGISCGMEYQGLGNDEARPKLYFETKQNILEGGIVVIHGAKQLKDIDGKNVGTSETIYTEDFDFYYDSENRHWVVIGNRVSAGAIIYNTPNLYNGYTVVKEITDVPSGVRDTGNQFVRFGDNMYITTGGNSNKLSVRNGDGSYLGALNVDFPLSELTTGPWCTLAPYNEGDRVSFYLFSFDRVDLSGEPYDHGSMYCWKAYDATNESGNFEIELPTSENDILGTINVIFPSLAPTSYEYKRKFARRDWYNSNNSYGEYSLDLNTNLLATKADILHKIGDNFTISYQGN